MKTILYLAVAWLLLIGGTNGQSTQPQPAPHAANPSASQQDSDDIEQMRADLQRLRVLLNQMRTNLAFVQSSQSPLKHQFEIEADAWQLMVEQMDRRLKGIEERKSRE